ncbi:peptidoglycan-binding protein [bacterium 1XD42-8]|jgi:hypothetical protein|nr:peptidoglycan-binding protein [Lachnospiraceae bacterium]RKJ37494.1 peptidoglycan-binding protein [bacterium 1XD42-8]
MPIKQVTAAQTDTPDKGKLTVHVTSTLGYIPVQNATVSISYTDTGTTMEQLQTDSSGQTETIELPAPPLEYSQIPSEPRPYSDYNLIISAPGYETLTISGSEVLPDVTSIQNVSLSPLEEPTPEEEITIPDHTLYGDYPPKIVEPEVKTVEETGEIILSRVVIPEYVIVHDGIPSNASAPNYYVRYKDYIKNVVSSEIYATWPESTIIANTLAIQSFTLNRVYTEWYRSKGYDFTITTSTAYDQKFIYGRNIYENIDRIVDEIFANYLSRPNITQPIFTQYCDGHRVTCPQGLSQWGSKYLGDEGYSAIQIIRYYYGSNMYINTSEEIAGVPASWPRYDLTIGSSGSKVEQVQEQLLRISKNYPAIPSITPDGKYGPATAAAVRAFQSIFNLPVTGVIDYSTWYKISNVYTGVTRIAEPGT